MAMLLGTDLCGDGTYACMARQRPEFFEGILLQLAVKVVATHATAWLQLCVRFKPGLQGRLSPLVSVSSQVDC